MQPHDEARGVEDVLGAWRAWEPGLTRFPTIRIEPRLRAGERVQIFNYGPDLVSVDAVADDGTAPVYIRPGEVGTIRGACTRRDLLLLCTRT